MGPDEDTRAGSELDDAETVSGEESSEGGFPALERGTSVGRYIIADRIGAGGMGVVYKAFDPGLNRPIALKMVTLTSEADETDSLCNRKRSRLLREAQALAQLSHPNVVTVHDVGTYQDSVFIAMELVGGQTLEDWLKQEPRSVAQVLEILLDAGRGLAAAHRAGIVHRDFKPQNVVLGQDHRVRVLDFGLARGTRSEADDPEAEGSDPAGSRGERIQQTPPPLATPPAEGFDPVLASQMDTRDDLLSSSITRAGMVVGTPAYMPPEQHLSTRVDERSDQFSYCVVLFEALYGRRPFRARTRRDFVSQVIQGRVDRPREAQVPAWLDRVVLRGLNADPALRHESMEALLEALASDPEAHRRARRAARLRALGLGGTLVFAVLAVIGVWYGMSRGFRLCRGGAGRVEEAWNQHRRRAVAGAFRATGLPFAETSLNAVEAELDRTVARWVEQHTEACEATHVRGEQSEELLDLRMICLNERLEEVRALVDLFARADGQIVEKSVQAVSSLDQLTDCADRKALTARVPPPRDPAARERVSALRSRIAQGKALERAGKYQDALGLVPDLTAAARQTGYRPVLAEALQLQGIVQEKNGAFEQAARTFEEAIQAADASGDDPVRADLLNQLAFLVGYELSRIQEGLREGQRARAVLDRLGDAQDQEANWEKCMGTLLALQGNFEQAKEHFLRSIALRERLLGPDHLDVAYALANLGSVYVESGQYDEALKLQQRALGIRERNLGPHHPDVATSLNSLGNIYSNRGQYEEGLAAHLRALSIWEQAVGPEHSDVAMSLNNIGSVYLDQGDYDLAQPYFERSLRIREKVFGPEHLRLTYSLNNLGATLAGKGEYERARLLMERSLSIREKAMGPEHPALAYTCSGLGEIALETGQLDRALAYYQRARRLHEKGYGGEHPDLAGVLIGLGRVLHAQRRLREASGLFERALGVCQQKGCIPGIAGQARLGLAMTMWDRGEDRSKAVELARQAREELTARKALRRELARADAWLAAHKTGGP